MTLAWFPEVLNGCLEIIYIQFSLVMGVSLEKGSAKLPISSCHHSRSYLRVLNKFIFEFVFSSEAWWVSGGRDSVWSLHSDCPTAYHLASLRERNPHPWCSGPHKASPSSHLSNNHFGLLWRGAWTWTEAQRGLVTWLCSMAFWDRMAIAIYAQGYQCHSPFRVNLERPSPSPTLIQARTKCVLAWRLKFLWGCSSVTNGKLDA